MPATTLHRRSFLRPNRTEEAPVRTVKIDQLGEARQLFPFTDQELPAVPIPAAPLTFQSGLTPYSGSWGAPQAAHLLRRTGFGLKKTDLDLLKGMSMDTAVGHVLNVNTTPPAPPVNNYQTDFADPDVLEGQTWTTAAYNGDVEGYRIQSWRGWWNELMLNEEASVLERMTLFWHNHFATQTEIVYWGRSVYDYNSKLRANAIGNFKTLTKQVTLDGMMLLYLNGALNSKEAPNENYARELQELFTVGKDNPDHYTEDDVVAAARVLTGWRINFNDNTSFHYPVEHDFGNKQFSAFYNNTVIQGSVNGEAELDALLDMIFAKSEVAEFICRKLYRWLVYYHIDDNTEQQIIKPLAAIFRNNNYEILPVLETLLKSDHFYEAAQTGCFIKTPLDMVIGTMRTFNVTVPSTTLWDNYVLNSILSYFHYEMKMMPGDPPNVAGWQAFRQTPQYYRLWINGDTIRLRNVFTDVMAYYYFESDNDKLFIDLIAFISQFSDPGNPNKLIDDITGLLFVQPVSAAKKYLLKTILLSGLPTDSYWTNAWSDYTNNPTDPMALEVVQSRLKGLHVYLTRLPEFQLG